MSISFWPAIQVVTGGGNPGESGTPTPIARDSQWTVVAFEASSTAEQFVELPSGCDVGDVVEIHAVPVDSFAGSFNVLPPSGEVFAVGEARAPGFFRKINSTTWASH